VRTVLATIFFAVFVRAGFGMIAIFRLSDVHDATRVERLIVR
jgi:hypothetical protein